MKRPPVLIPLLALACAIFIGILVYVYVETKSANPQMLDEQGRPRRSEVGGRAARAEASIFYADVKRVVPTPRDSGPWPQTPDPQS